MSCRRTVGVLAWLVLTAACAAPLTLPKEFVELKDPGEGYRAVTSDDARLRVREFREATEGDVAFWGETLRLDLVQQRGYEPVDAGELTNAVGVGRWYEFAANVDGERVGYFVAVWARPASWLLGSPKLVVVEFAARDAVFRQRLAAVRAALATLRG